MGGWEGGREGGMEGGSDEGREREGRREGGREMILYFLSYKLYHLVLAMHLLEGREGGRGRGREGGRGSTSNNEMTLPLLSGKSLGTRLHHGRIVTNEQFMFTAHTV